LGARSGGVVIEARVVERNLWLSIPDAFAAMVAARAGFDSVTLDMQHGLFDERAVVAVLMALGEKRPKRLVRVPAVEAGVIGKVLDAGADGVIAPLVNSAGDARRLVEACWYPPKGGRSFGPMLAGMRAGGRPYAAAAGEIEVFAMIETAAGLDAVEAIAAVEGVTGLYVGPNDLAIALGLGAGSDREEAAVLAAFGRVVAAAKASGKRAGLFCGGAAYARRIAPLGFDFLTVVSDAAALQAGLAGALAVMDQPEG
jgi:4-hydroxy-2-oxoheptanedioate aldolase